LKAYFLIYYLNLLNINIKKDIELPMRPTIVIVSM